MKKVVLGMSGGVDSSVSAFLLKQQGYEVIGVTFDLYKSPANLTAQKCSGEKDIADAKKVCDLLGIQHYVYDCKDIFKKEVVERFVNSYNIGQTPNPCIDCNRLVKFKLILEKAEEFGADYISTGHYGKVVYNEKSGRYNLLRSEKHIKDQSYALYTLNQEQLSKLIFPLSIYDKEQIREIGKSANLPVFDKADSQDICFIPDGDYPSFLESYTGKSGIKGNFVDLNGNVIMQHEGIWKYTIGQRRGHGIAMGKRAFISNIDPLSGNITVTDNEDFLYTDTLYADNVNLIEVSELTEPVKLYAKIRYSHKEAPCTAYPDERGIKVVFDTPQRAITAGQAVVLYNGESVYGGGTIL